MFTYILIGLNAGLLALMLIILIKLIMTDSRIKQAGMRVDEQVTQLSKQNQAQDQQLRENLLVNFAGLQQAILEKLSHSRVEQTQQSADLREQLQQAFAQHRARFDERQMEALKILHDTLQKGVQDTRQQVSESLSEHSSQLSKRVEQLTLTTETKLKEINQQVEKRLAEGFEKTNETFGDVIKRLALIDAAQKKITELSSSVVSLQEILNDKRSRGAFGEVQLSALIYNMIPEQHFSFQHQLSNNRRPDCMLFLPEPTGNIAIDAKFPLENFRLLIDSSLTDMEKQQAIRQFKLDIRKHIQDIAEKYIIPGETADGAVMFIPAEAVFAEIHAHHSDLVEFAQKSKIWMVSPTTMMAILTTARAVLKDAATRQQVHEIQKHLRMLAEDFERFQMRMDNLAKRIAQAHTDVEQVHISSRKITQRFVQIERAELNGIKTESVLIAENPDTSDKTGAA
ncbi:DNA recombination protein RmuC [Aquicella lusitana]|uniref:DNA recombination protein RmuC n=1 Tax=Aquicella lusitana TaxID=254246 RepID=A0A370GHK0_9COXI|nr:DNA recombination protein RmuC [Aquicella lusitana]RDI42840.1 DNA recombination protein RmuC [Aquicella lusitana]VVC73083.1 DNA recombination protein RmuC [Aquicella lusitana]